MSVFEKLTKKSETPAEGFAGLDAAASTAASAAVPATAPVVTEEQKNLVKGLPVPSAAIDVNVLAYLNSAISVAVAEAVKSMAPALAEIGKASRLTREELMVLSGKDPAAEAAFKARLLRERNEWQTQESSKRENLAKIQAACTHKDDNQKPSFQVVHNYPDRQVRFLCAHCFLSVEPRRWVIDSPEPLTGKERSHLEPAHPLYDEWFKIANQLGKL